MDSDNIAALALVALILWLLLAGRRAPAGEVTSRIWYPGLLGDDV